MNKKILIYKIIVALIIVALAVVLLTTLTREKDRYYHLTNRGDLGPLTRSDINLVTVEAPKQTLADGTVSAEAWRELFPYLTDSLFDNRDNDEIVDYLEQDPYLVNIYEGYGFAKDYGSARGHAYTLTDVGKTKRINDKSLASCLTCKSSTFSKMVQDQGVGVYTKDFHEVYQQITAGGEGVTCYTCHGNEAGSQGTLQVTHTYVTEALGENMKAIDPGMLSCGQCHIEYYFTAVDSDQDGKLDNETMMPYHSVAEMTPEAILAYYDAAPNKDGGIGFYDWVQPSTGAHMLKTQHPEFETVLQGVHAANGMSCADCHMEIKMGEDGTVYHSHELVSPLKSEALLQSCAVCHEGTDMTAKVRAIQSRITSRETKVGNRLSELKDALAQAVADGKLPEEELDAVRKLYREAQWFFDFCYVENSEGAHNSALSTRCLDTAEAKIAEAMELLG